MPNKEFIYEINLGKNKIKRKIEGVQNLMAVNELISLLADYCDANGLKIGYSYEKIEED